MLSFSLSLLQDLGERLTAELTVHEDILTYCFRLLAHDKTCLMACQFLEDLLQARRQVLNLQSVTHLRQLIQSLDDNKLANFCRVLAVTISDLDIYENKSSLFAQNKQKRTKGFVNIRDINQELLLSIPDLLPRLINIACVKDYTPRYRGTVSELDCWMEWIENTMSDAAFDPPETDDLDQFIGGELTDVFLDQFILYVHSGLFNMKLLFCPLSVYIGHKEKLLAQQLR